MKNRLPATWTPEMIRQHLADSSRALADLTASMVFDNPVLLKYLIEVIWLDCDPWSQRASRVVCICSCRFPELFRPYSSIAIHKLYGLKSEGARRNLLKIFADVPVKLRKKEEEMLINYCFNCITESGAISIKAYSMEILYRKSLINPEIGVALCALIGEDLADMSPGLRSLGLKILKSLHRRNFQQAQRL